MNNVETCVDLDSFLMEPITIQNEGTVDEPDLYTFKFSSGNYLTVTELPYQTAR